MNKKIKEIKKLYQASLDGGEPSIFHKKCDNIPNTLVLYKTKGNRRFGGYVSECWKSKGKFILDEKCFLFSLDREKFYFSKNGNYFIFIYKINIYLEEKELYNFMQFKRRTKFWK